MKKTQGFLRALTALAGFLFLAPLAGAQHERQQLPDADAREVRGYALTEAGLAKYAQATRSLKGIKIEDCDEDDEVKSLAEAAAKIDAVPAAKAAVQSAGMTSREYVVFAFTLLDAGFGAYTLQTPGGKLPAGANTANVEFFQKHSAELHQLANETEDESCEDDDDD